MMSESRRRDLALNAAVLLLESLAFFVCAAVIASTDDKPSPPVLCFLAAAAGGYLLARGLRRLDLPNSALVLIGGVLSALALIALVALSFAPRGFPPYGFGRGPAPQFYQLLGAALLSAQWARAVWLVRQPLQRMQIGASFSLAMAVLAVGLLFAQDSSARDAVNGAAIPMVAAGLLAMALVHQRDAQQAGGETMRGPWLSITAGSIAGLAIAGVALGALPLGPFGWLLDHTLAPAIQWAFVIIVWLTLIVAFPFLLLLSWLITSITGGRVDLPPPQIADTTQVKHKVTQGHPDAFVAALLLLLKIAFVLLAVAAAAYLAYRLFGRLKQAEPEVEEERETMEAEGSLLGDLAGLLRGLRARRTAEPAGDPNLPESILDVRRLYLGLLARSADRGVERPPGATPDEFAPALERSLASPVAARATTAFVAARYGLVPPSPDELRQLQHDTDALS